MTKDEVLDLARQICNCELRPTPVRRFGPDGLPSYADDPERMQGDR